MIELSRISIILVEPETPANIGAIARATKNMGIQDIRLVNPCEFLNDEGFKLAHGAKDQLLNFQVFPTIEAAISDIQVLVGTTNRRRDKQWPILTPKETIQTLETISANSNIGFLFGRESDGLTNEELQHCNLLTHIPTTGYHPAINLAQAVMIYAYELFTHSSQAEPPYTWTPANKEEEQQLYKKISDTLPYLPLHPKKGVQEFTSLFRRVLGRTLLESRDIRLFHKLFDLIKKVPGHSGSKVPPQQ